jgi:glycosyltransferase involved in cell wall biosynthesis
MGEVRRVTIVGSGAGIGGTERHIAGLLAGLPPLGFAVELVTSEVGPLGAHARAHGAAWTVVLRPGPIRYCLALTRHFRRTRPDVVHAHAGRLPCLAARLAGVPRILDTRHGHLDPRLGDEVSDPPERRPRLEGRDGDRGRDRGRVARTWRWRLEGFKGRLAHVTLTVCEADAEILVRRGGLPAARVHAVPNGLAAADLAGPGPDADTLPTALPQPDTLRTALPQPAAQSERPRAAGLLGWVGRMTEQKAPERALHVLHELLQTRDLPDSVRAGLRLVFVGDGPLRSALVAEAEALGVAARVEFRGPLADPRPALRELRVLLLPSRREGLPYVLLESLAAGTPVLATPVGGNAEVLNGELSRGLLTWERSAWGAAAARLLRDDAAWARASSAGLLRIRDFGEDRMVEQIARFYRA